MSEPLQTQPLQTETRDFIKRISTLSLPEGDAAQSVSEQKGYKKILLGLAAFLDKNNSPEGGHLTKAILQRLEGQDSIPNVLGELAIGDAPEGTATKLFGLLRIHQGQDLFDHIVGRMERIVGEKLEMRNEHNEQDNSDTPEVERKPPTTGLSDFDRYIRKNAQAFDKKHFGEDEYIRKAAAEWGGDFDERKDRSPTGYEVVEAEQLRQRLAESEKALSEAHAYGKIAVQIKEAYDNTIGAALAKSNQISSP